MRERSSPPLDGRSDATGVIYVARQLGHGADLTMKTYGHVIDELEDAPRISAEDAIAAARERNLGRSRVTSDLGPPKGR